MIDARFEGLAVTLIVDSFQPAASGGRVGRRLASVLREAGARVTVLAPPSNPGAPLMPGVELVPLTTRIHPLARHLVRPGYVDAFKASVQPPRRSVIHFAPLGYNKSRYLLETALDSGARTVVQLWGYDLYCQSYFAFRDGRPCHDCAGGSALQALVSRCGSRPRWPLESTSRKLLRHRLYECDAFLSSAAPVDAALLKMGADAGRILRLPVPYAPEESEPNEGPGEGVVCWSAALRTKGLDLLPDLARLCPEVTFETFVAHSPRTDESQEIIRRLEQAANITADRQSSWSTGVAQRARNARVALLPSMWDTPIEYALLEAMGAARAIVAFRAGAHAEYLKHDENALLSEPGDLQGMATNVRRLMQDETLAMRLGGNARLTFERLTSRHSLLDTLATAYGLA